jgi:hypothetical protein
MAPSHEKSSRALVTSANRYVAVLSLTLSSFTAPSFFGHAGIGRVARGGSQLLIH